MRNRKFNRTAIGMMALLAVSCSLTFGNTVAAESINAQQEQAGPGVDLLARSGGVVETQAVYVKDSEFSGEGNLVFQNDSQGIFICLSSDMTLLPEQLEDGRTYTISHSQVMLMSYPGQLPQVYGIRTLEDEYHDTIAEVVSADENSVLFARGDGTQFMVYADALGGVQAKAGDRCVVSHTDAMTRSLPGTYMDVNRVAVLPAAE